MRCRTARCCARRWSPIWQVAAAWNTASRPGGGRAAHPAHDRRTAARLRGDRPHFVKALQPIEWRYTNDPAWVMRTKGDRLPHNRVWVKALGEVPDDPMLHTATMVYSSDTTVLDSVITTHGLSWGFDRIFAASANHSIWFHRQVNFNDWVLYSTSSPVAADSRGLGTGHFFDRSAAAGHRGPRGRPEVFPIFEPLNRYPIAANNPPHSGPVRPRSGVTLT